MMRQVAAPSSVPRGKTVCPAGQPFGNQNERMLPAKPIRELIDETLADDIDRIDRVTFPLG